jgi:hypothetical protein
LSKKTMPTLTPIASPVNLPTKKSWLEGFPAGELMALYGENKRYVVMLEATPNVPAHFHGLFMEAQQQVVSRIAPSGLREEVLKYFGGIVIPPQSPGDYVMRIQFETLADNCTLIGTTKGESVGNMRDVMPSDVIRLEAGDYGECYGLVVKRSGPGRQLELMIPAPKGRQILVSADRFMCDYIGKYDSLPL